MSFIKCVVLCVLAFFSDEVISFCDFPTTPTRDLVENLIYLQHAPTKMCVGLNRFLDSATPILRSCQYWKQQTTTDRYFVTYNLPQKSVLKTVIISKGDRYACLTRDGYGVKMSSCDVNRKPQTWKALPVSGHPTRFLIELHRSGYCLIPEGERPGSKLRFDRCNDKDSLQTWRIVCADVPPKSEGSLVFTQYYSRY